MKNTEFAANVCTRMILWRFAPETKEKQWNNLNWSGLAIDAGAYNNSIINLNINKQ